MSSLVQMYSRKIGELEKRIAQLENINRELSGSLEWHIEANERYEKELIFTDEELEIIQRWGFNCSTEYRLNEKEKEVYFKITNAHSDQTKGE